MMQRLTEALVSVYLGTNYAPEELEKELGGGHHVFYFPNYDVLFPDAASDEEIHRRMWTAINFFGKDSSGPVPPGKSFLVLQTYSSWDRQRYWNNEDDSIRRRSEYRNRRLQMFRTTVKNLYSSGPVFNINPKMYVLLFCSALGL
jgi:hypothetical protein